MSLSGAGIGAFSLLVSTCLESGDSRLAVCNSRFFFYWCDCGAMVADTAQVETKNVNGIDDDDADDNGVKREEKETEQGRQYAEERKRDLHGGKERVDQKFKALEYLLSQSKVSYPKIQISFFFV